MLGYVVRRIAATIPVMALVALFVFSLLYIAPGDPAAVIAGDQATPADVERIRQSLGLDRPFLVQFGDWVWNIVHANLGTSMFTGLPVKRIPWGCCGCRITMGPVIGHDSTGLCAH